MWTTWFRDRYLRKGFYKSSFFCLAPWVHAFGGRFKSVAPYMLQGLEWRIGDGRSVNLWNDRWLVDQPLASIFPHHGMDGEAMVDSLIVGQVPTFFPPAVKDFISQNIQLLCPPTSLHRDQASWSLSSSGACSILSAWNMLRSSAPPCPWSKVVWHN